MVKRAAKNGIESSKRLKTNGNGTEKLKQPIIYEHLEFASESEDDITVTTGIAMPDLDMVPRSHIASYFEQNGCKLARHVENMLKEATKAKLNKVANWQDVRYQHSSVRAAIETGELIGCALYCEKEDKNASTIIATSKINTGECVAAYMGRLWERKSWDKHIGSNDDMRHLWAYDISKTLLDGYRGPELVVESSEYGNEARFFNDPSWNTMTSTPEEEPNLEASVVWHAKHKMPYVGFFATRTIEPGQELFLGWGEDAWKALARIQMRTQACVCHLLHLRIQQLERLLTENSIQPTEPTPLENEDVDEEAVVLFDHKHQGYYTKNKEGMTNRLVTSTLLSKVCCQQTSERYQQPETIRVTAEAGLVPVSLAEAMQVANCENGTCSRFDSLGKAALHRLKKVVPNEQLDTVKYSAAIREMIDTGVAPKCEVREVLALHHPARFFCPPHQRCFGVVANAPIRPGEPLFVYAGIFEEEQKFHRNYATNPGQVYAYEIPNTEIGSLSTNGYSGPTLIVESHRYGNIARFVNDCWCRVGGEKTVNTKAEVIWDSVNKVPQILFRATKWITNNEEIVTNYGDTFWQKVTKYNMIAHSQYWKYATNRVKHLEEMISQNSLDLPTPEWTKDTVHEVGMFNLNAVDYSKWTAASATPL